MEYGDYIARNKNGDLVRFNMSYWVPWRRGNIWICNEWVNLGAYQIGDIIKDKELLNKYKDLKWEDNPIKLQTCVNQ